MNNFPRPYRRIEEEENNQHRRDQDIIPSIAECRICSSSQQGSDRRAPIRHRHFSSLYLREITGVEDSTIPYLCPSCMIAHLPYPVSRNKIVISDTTLHQFFAPPGHVATNGYSGDRIHTDYITIEGADIRTLMHAFQYDYVDKPPKRPMDVVLVAGYYDLVNGNSREYIIEKMHEFSDAVKLSGDGAELGTFVVATMMYPPQLSWFVDDGPFPVPGYVNNRSKIDWINREIHHLNFQTRQTRL